MNIYTVRDNLIRTVDGKERLLQRIKVQLNDLDRIEGAGARGQEMALTATREFLEINIDELRRILEDLNICCKQATEQSWVGVDRQGGI